jgi:hypothetical protein
MRFPSEEILVVEVMSWDQQFDDLIMLPGRKPTHHWSRFATPPFTSANCESRTRRRRMADRDEVLLRGLK